MFYGELAETKDSVEISDCEYESLLELFRFIYSDEANLSPDNVMQLMYLAKTYMLHASNVFIVLPDAQKYEEKELINHCWKLMEKETDAVQSDGFVTIERSVLEKMVENDSLNIKEVELFKAVDRWAGKKCEKQGLVAEGSVKRRILGERIVKGIYFPLMELKEFASVVLDCDILTKKECFDMMKYFSSVLDIPAGFCGVKRTGYRNVLCRFQWLCNCWNHSSKYILGLTVDKNIKLHAIRIFGSDKSEYSVTLTVYSHETLMPVARESGKFSSKHIDGEIGGYEGFEIVFKTPIALEANIKYEFNAKITGPPSWYGFGGLCRVKHSGVTFFFSSPGTKYTSSEKGQFPEFLFIVD